MENIPPKAICKFFGINFYSIFYVLNHKDVLVAVVS